MATNKDLKWQITEQDHPEWVKFLDSGGSLVSSISGEGDTQLNVVIDDGAEGDDTHGFIYVRCISCKSQKSAQSIEVCRCVCNCETFSISGMSGNIPSSGMARGRQIGTYELSGSCSEDKIDIRINGSGLTLSNGNILLANDIPENREPSEITYTVTSSIVGGSACENNQFPLTQDGVTCNCGNVFSSATFYNIPKTGYTAGSEIGKYTLKQNDSCPVNITATLSGDNGSTYALVCNNNSISLDNSVSIPENTDQGERNFTASIYYKPFSSSRNQKCKSYNLTQPGVTCDCYIFKEFSVINPIPTSGYNQGDKIGTYLLTADGEHCPESNIHATLSGTNDTYELMFDRENYEVHLPSDKGISENINPDSIPFKLTLKYDNIQCGDVVDITQDGTGCGCSNFHNFDVETIPNSGITNPPYQIGTYVLDDGCLDSDYTLTETGGSFTLSVSNKKVYITSTVPENTATTQNTYRVELKYKNGSCETGRDIIQPGKDCGCGTLHDVTFIDIPSGGVSASENYEIGNYTTDSNVCNYTFVEVNNSFTMRGDNDTGKIIVTSDIPANTGYEPIDFTVIAKYGSDECVRSAITQEGSLKCDCESIGLMVSLRKKTYPNSGTDDWFLVASGNTYGCGSLSGFSNSALLAIDEGNSRVRVVQDPNDEYKFNFYIKVLPNPNGESGDDRSGGINLYFKKKGEEIYQDCNHPLEIYQTANYCDCDNFPDIKLYDTYNRMTEIPASGFTNQKVAYMESSAYVYKCHSIKVNSFGIPSWIHLEGIIRTVSTDDYRDTAYFTIDANPNDEPRSHRIYFNRIIDADENGKGGDSCQTPGYIDITQKGNACTCDDTGFNCFGYSSYSRERHIKPLQTEEVLSYELNCGQLVYNFRNGKPDWVTKIRIDSDEKKVYISFEENRDEDRSVEVDFYVLLDGRNCATCTLTFEQPAIHCNDCEAVLNYIKLYNTSDYCSPANERSVVYLDYDYNTCGSLSATTESPYVTNMIIKDYPVTERHAVVVNLEDNETDENRDILFNVFLVDEHGDITPNASCVKTATICQEPKKEPACKCTAATLSVTDKVAELVGGTQGEIKIAKATLGKRYDWYTLDCLKIIPSTSHMVTPANPNGEYTSIRIDDNTGDIYVTVADRIVGTTKHTTKIDISVHDMSTGEEITCDTLSTNFTIDVIPNVPENENQEDNP